jgi:5-oxoprolinase (ATP-hydrolysing)
MPRWQFSIDVGGTFTDCLGLSPQGNLVRTKVLSSGQVMGACAAGSSETQIVDPARSRDPAGFWSGCRLTLLDAEGQRGGEARVVDSTPADAALHLIWHSPPAAHLPVGQPYELASGVEAPILAIHWLLGIPLSQPLPAVDVRLGTTRGTNALITRRGARTALVTTRGFGDVLRIGYQNRPRLFDLAIKKHEPLFTEVVEVDERVSSAGEILRPLDGPAALARLRVLRQSGIESIAICLLNAYVQPVHENQLADLAREAGFDEVSLSSRVAPFIKVVSRGDTTVVDAYLSPVLRAYVGTLRRSLPTGSLKIMTSAGGLVDAREFVGKDSILSGPAGGVVGFSRVAASAGFDRALGFDMGGTSTDVSRFDGRHEMEYETEKAGVRVVAPMLSVETVAAGGGSICRFDGVKLVVGPDSAGADPGPACYGKGGPLTVTDLNFYLGKVLAERFPFPLDRNAARRRLVNLAAEVHQATGRDYTPEALAAGLIRIANATMVRAIHSVSVAKGADPREYVLVAFGGAAGQHACQVAEELGMTRILLHPDAGVLSAYGIGVADVERHKAAGLYLPYSEEALASLETTFSRLSDEALAELQGEGFQPSQVRFRRFLDVRYRGVEAALKLAEPEAGTVAQAFSEEHMRRYGYVQAERPMEIVAARVEAVASSGPALARSTSVPERQAEPNREVVTWFGERPFATRVYQREDLQPGHVVHGPAIVGEPLATTVIDPGWKAAMLTGGELLLTRDGQAARSETAQALGGTADPVLLEIFNNQFAGVAEQMGIALRNTASSVNVKERLDFSCAIFTSRGDLVVNAPHIPVHLGAMSETVKGILEDHPAIRPGDAFITNDPFRGGSHLPDVTVVTPVCDPGDGQILFFTASRAHHAEIGGIRPGSMPPFSRNLAEEGVLIKSFRLIEGGESRFDRLRELLLGGRHPTRAIDDNLADVAAQVAANQRGVRDLLRMVDRYGLPTVQAYMQHIQEAARLKVQRAISRRAKGRSEFVDHLDDGSPIQVAVTLDGSSATIDFTGTGGVLPGNLNANRAITTAAALYALRLLIDEDIPLNQGVLADVRLILPPCLLNPPPGQSPETSAAVVGGNVETSQRVVDVLLGAFGLAAASQGTMNNLLFGDSSFGYYETICGGAGATADHDGASAVHTHMTNTRLTDVEVMERRYPVRVRQFAIRRGSGGRGARRGGDGVVRAIEFLRSVDVSLLTGRRGPYPPYGMAGGEPGQFGRNQVFRTDGTLQVLKNADQFTAGPGDVLVIETPGGGGWGAAGDAGSLR